VLQSEVGRGWELNEAMLDGNEQSSQVSNDSSRAIEVKGDAAVEVAS